MIYTRLSSHAISIRSYDSNGEPNVNVGDFDEVAKAIGNKLSFGSYGCEVALTIKGSRILAQDNLQCGGNGVTFGGEYRKR
jgi:hypothetical protein